MHGLYVTSHEPGVGKTTVIAALVGALRAQGHDLGVMRPVETACPIRQGRRYPPDAHYLRGAAGVMDDLGLICPLASSEPSLPLSEPLELAQVTRAASFLAERHAAVLAEGPGGILVPLDARQTEVDLIAAVGWPVLLVIEAKRGYLGHALLALEALRRAEVAIAGMILNLGKQPLLDRGPDEAQHALARWGRVPVFGIFPSLLTHESHLLAEAARALDLKALLASMRSESRAS